MNAGIIFDCDGTLVDSLGTAMASFNFALAKMDHPPQTPEMIKQYFGQSGDRILTGVLGDAEKGKQAFQHYIEHQIKSAKNTFLHKGVRALLETIRENDIPMAIVTGRHSQDLALLLEPHGLGDYFVTLIADNHLKKSKPAPDGILLAAERMHLSPEKTFYVGDSATDLQAARSAGAIPVAALWDTLAKETELTREKPTFVTRSPMEVWTHFHNHFQHTLT